jgi:uncharacterized repeat protein (TIGR03803 family)
MLGLCGLSSARAQTLVVLHSFTSGADGANPYAPLIQDAWGNLYGTTYAGGSGYGVVFKLEASGKDRVLHSFTGGADGANPYAGPVMDTLGNLYGTTYGGGSGFGVVFRLDPLGNETVLHSFTGGVDGSNPYSGLLRDPAGNLYGTTLYGGTYGLGTVFKIDADGRQTVLHSFRGCADDGAYPKAPLIEDSLGNLYGTTLGGGTLSRCGTLRALQPPASGVVFKVDQTGNETVLHTFTYLDGAHPSGGLIQDSAGNLYGTTNVSGPGSQCFYMYMWRRVICVGGNGVVFKLASGETMLHGFTGAPDGTDPIAPLIRGTAGDFYGTTRAGGSGYGVVFKLGATGTETLLHTFRRPDGANPYAGLIRDSAGDLYGTTSSGGSLGFGTVFKIVSSGATAEPQTP